MALSSSRRQVEDVLVALQGRVDMVPDFHMRTPASMSLVFTKTAPILLTVTGVLAGTEK